MNKSLTLLVTLVLMLTSCERSDPVKLGFIGGLTGPVAGLGAQSRNGMLLAVEDWNARGGIHGQPIEVIIKDDQNQLAGLPNLVQTLVAAEVDAIIGPSNSTMAVTAAPLADKAGIVMLGTSVATDLLSGRDDNFLRIMPTTQNSGHQMMDYLMSHLPFTRYTLIIDSSNHAYTESWARAVKERGDAAGKVNHLALQFQSGDNLTLLQLAQQLALEENELILICANSVDAALLIRQIRNFDRSVAMAGCEWLASTEMLKLAGEDAEGLYANVVDIKQSHKVAYIDLQNRFQERFQLPLESSGLVAYTITNAALYGLANKTHKQSLKAFLLAEQTLHSDIADFRFDKNGDLAENVLSFVKQVQNQQFVYLDD